MNAETDNSTRRQKVFVVDDDNSARESLTWLLNTEGIETESYASAEAFLDNWSADLAGCITADIRMPGKSGLQLQAKLNELGNMMPIVILTGHADVPVAIRAMKQGAFDFLQKPYSDEELLTCVNNALHLENDIYLSQQNLLVAIDDYRQLTERERAVMGRVVDGLTNKLIASELGISEKTVEVHRARMMEKMGAKTLSELVRIGMVLDQRLEHD